VQLHPSSRNVTLLFAQLGEFRPQFGFVHTVSFTSSGPSQSTLMPSPDLPDLDQIATRLVQLRHRLQDLARVLERADERHHQFPSEHSQKTLDDLRAEDASLRAEIAEHEETIRPLLRRPEDP
jgi:hypothetical protein